MSNMATVTLNPNEWTLAVTSAGAKIAFFAPGTVWFQVASSTPSNVPPTAPAMPLKRGEPTSMEPDSGDKIYLYWMRDGEGGATLAVTYW